MKSTCATSTKKQRKKDLKRIMCRRGETGLRNYQGKVSEKDVTTWPNSFELRTEGAKNENGQRRILVGEQIIGTIQHTPNRTQEERWGTKGNDNVSQGGGIRDGKGKRDPAGVEGEEGRQLRSEGLPEKKMQLHSRPLQDRGGGEPERG